MYISETSQPLECAEGQGLSVSENTTYVLIVEMVIHHLLSRLSYCVNPEGRKETKLNISSMGFMFYHVAKGSQL